MKKIIALLIAIVMTFALVGCSSGGVPQEEFDKVTSENEELKKKVESLKNSVDEATELLQQYIDSAEDDLMSGVPLMMYEATAAMLDDNATCVALNDSVVQITVPLTEPKTISDYQAELEAAAYSIGIALDEDGYSSCIIMFIDGESNCVGGFSCGLGRDVTAFIQTGT